MPDSTQLVALVTGGSGRVGRSISRRLARDGHAVVLVDSPGDAKAHTTASAIAATGGTAIAMDGDIANLHDMTAIFDRVEQHFGGVDVVVNAAGVMVHGPIASFDLVDLDRMHRVNIRGAFVVSQLAAGRVRPGGTIINISAAAVKLQMAGYSAYAASKAAVNAMTMVLAQELLGRDITVNAVMPGPGAEDPADISRTVSFLVGRGRWVNGRVISAAESREGAPPLVTSGRR